MTTAELLTTLRDNLAGDDILKAWCVSNLSAPTIQIDFDDQQEVEDFPLIAFVQISQDDGIVTARQVWTVNGSVFVKNVNRTKAIVNGCTTYTYDGRLECEGLREQVVAAIYRAKIGKVHVTSEAMSHSFHPRYVSPFILTIETIKTI